jgi:hypothetical protein
MSEFTYTTVHDQFAMAALTGLLANANNGGCLRIPNPKGLETAQQQLAHWAFVLADEMMKVREGNE